MSKIPYNIIANHQLIVIGVIPIYTLDIISVRKKKENEFRCGKAPLCMQHAVYDVFCTHVRTSYRKIQSHDGTLSLKMYDSSTTMSENRRAIINKYFMTPTIFSLEKSNH